MNRRGSYHQSVKLCSVLMLLFLLNMSSHPALSTSAQAALPTPLSVSVDLDEDLSQWGIFEEKGNPISDISNVTSPSLDGRSLRCAILGGDVYSNVHCYRNLAADSASDVFSLSMSFQYRPASSFNNAGVPSIVQGLEFTMSKWENGIRYEWALQWDNVDLGAPKWRYWDPAQPDPNKWVDVGVSGGVNGMEWHTLKIEGEISNGLVHYRRFIFDLQEYPLDITVAPASAVGEPDRLSVAVQLDGNSTESPYELIIDKVTLVTTQTFADVSLNYWAFNWIKRLYTAGITGGCSMSPLQYCPEDIVTRAQMAIFLERGIHGSSYAPPAVGGSTAFNDVSLTYWAGAWIKQLAAEGITGGCGSGNYCPESPVTRAQMAIFLLRSKYGVSYSPPAAGVSTGFLDVDPTYWAGAWIKQLVAEGITAGCGSGNYCPESPVTRAQMAVFLVRTFNLP
jgi:S-layer family protein